MRYGLQAGLHGRGAGGGRWLLAATLAIVGCSSSASPTLSDDNALYPYVPPNGEAVPVARQSATWVAHMENDLLPYWMMDSAKGAPQGNFPTYRGMDGRVLGDSNRYLRMMSRQTYAYAIGFLVTGDAELLRLADAGAQWILDHGWDADNGGWYQQLNADGTPSGTHPKYAQDAAYAVLGLSAYFFVTRDQEAEAAILRTRDLLFDERAYFEPDTGRIKDGLSADMTTEVDQDAAGWELVAQLDPINAFMLLVQPVLTSEQRRDQFLADLRQLSDVMWTEFFEDGIFWGIAQNKGRYGTRHVDFGHNLKAFWMIREVDKRLRDAPYFDRLAENVDTQVMRAYDSMIGRWAKRPLSDTNLEFGSDWWIYAEADQIAATLSLSDASYNEVLESTQAAWLDDYVDERYGEVIPNVQRNGTPGWPWSVDDAAKCNLWKSGYHSMEHALMMYLVGTYLEDQPARLFFAVPEADFADFEARPYLLRGRERQRTVIGPVAIADRSLTVMEVLFDRLH